MSFTINKSKCIEISHYIVIFVIPLQYFASSLMEEVPMFKYFGVTLSSDISWSPHIQGVCSKTWKL